MMTRLGATILFLSIVPAFLGCSGGEGGIVEVSRERQCRANMNTLCTDQANYRDATGRWAGTNEELDRYARRTRPLTCPVSDEQYIIELRDDGYIVRCPCGHGSVDTGRRSWTAGDSS
ncbi:MAG: hypothetical protein AVO35_10085 [Candidatus Aegiribacteria sp. MLS_C]|nr:MAG: hypothetical protein AVO35_10085 [Candidatus Aegiribacteria sp. MLS_C]